MKVTKVVLVDDIDGSEATRTVKLDVDGRRYEIDLNDANYRGLMDALAPYTRAGRSLNRRRKPATPPSA